MSDSWAHANESRCAANETERSTFDRGSNAHRAPASRALVIALIPALLTASSTTIGSADEGSRSDPNPYRSPLDLAYSPDGALLAVSDRSAREAVIFDARKGSVARRVPLRGEPTGVAFAADRTLLVAEYDAGSVAAIDLEEGAVTRRYAVGLRPMGIALSHSRGLLVAANTVSDDVSIVDLTTGEERARIRVPREPFFVAVSPDGRKAAVTNLLPRGSAASPDLAAVVSLIDLDRLEHERDLRLPPGSTSVREIAISADGRRAYTVHTIGRFHVPATQLDRGWVNTNALSILDLEKGERLATLLLDHSFRGAADPWGVQLTNDDKALWVSIRGTHEIARVDIEKLEKLLAPLAQSSARASDGAEPIAHPTSVWDEVRADPARRDLLASDLSALHVARAIERFPIDGRGPRGLALSPDGETLAVALYHSASIALVDARTGSPRGSFTLGPERSIDLARRGEMLFHDATLSFQSWLSCSTCHPDEARTDGLRWDLLNDGLGTPQRTRSLLWAHRVRPTTARGVRAGIEESVPKGLVFLVHEPDPELVEPLIAYLESLEPERSPYLTRDGRLTDAAERGRKLFEGKARCARCHEGDLGSDLTPHDVGTRGEHDRVNDRFYTPRLVELYRTAPFLHDGRAATLEEIFTIYNREGRHGNASELTEEELAELIDYLESR